MTANKVVGTHGLSAILHSDLEARPPTLSESRLIPANFDRVADVYRWLEYFTFGPMLGQCRFHFLARLQECERVLILGDGDGRFVEKFLRANSRATLDIVDSSGKMLKLLHRRVQRIKGAEDRVTLIEGDAREVFTKNAAAMDGPLIGDAGSPLRNNYDLVVSHFFLDCFTTAEVETIVGQIELCLTGDARWLVSEFAVPSGNGLARAASRLTIGGLYRFFGVVTGLDVRRLPDHAGAFLRGGFYLSKQHSRFWGLLSSELWQVKTPESQTRGKSI